MLHFVVFFPRCAAGPKRVDHIQFAELLFTYAASAESRVFDVLLQPDKLTEYHALSNAIPTQRGTIAWSEFAAFWNNLTTQFEAEAFAKDKKGGEGTAVGGPTSHPLDAASASSGTGSVAYMPLSSSARPLSDVEKAEVVRRRRERRRARLDASRMSTTAPATPPGLRHVSDWSHGRVPITDHPLWSQALSDSWRGVDAAGLSTRPEQLERIIEHYRGTLEDHPRDAAAKLALAMALYASGLRKHVPEVGALFKDAIESNAHAGDPLTLYRAAMAFDDAVSTCCEVVIYFCRGILHEKVFPI